MQRRLNWNASPLCLGPQVPVQLPVAPTPPELEQRQELGGASVADEVAAMNAEMCAALSGLVGEDSPDKASRWGASRPGSSCDA